jgi:Protein of unknown function (DUF992)
MGSQSTVNAHGDYFEKESLMRKILSISLLSLALVASAAEAKSGVKVGILSCHVAGGAGFIIGSSKGVDCIYDPASGARREHYSGSIGKLGIDIGVTNQATLEWVVFAPGKINKGALRGTYTGASAEATVVVGLGANVLVGGFKKGINLQPLSVQGQTGLNIAAGVASLKLH